MDVLSCGTLKIPNPEPHVAVFLFTAILIPSMSIRVWKRNNIFKTHYLAQKSDDQEGSRVGSY